VVVLEVGLGGRLDAVNLIDPDVAVLTTVALDHQDWLGETREEIGAEKAGIFRAGAPAVCGETDLPLTVINHAQALSAKLMRRGEVYDFIKHADASVAGAQVWDWQGSCRGEPVSLQNLPLPSLPLVNAATALQALHQLNIDIPESAIREGLLKANLPGRYQRLEHPVPMLLDVAHNPEAAAYLVERLQEEKPSGRMFALVGMLADKDSDEVLSIMRPAIDEWAVCDLDTPRAIAAETLHTKLTELGETKVSRYANAGAAMSDLRQRVQEDDLLIVFGSFFTVGAVLETLSIEP
jgi:dihydrofolate synthase/folylpolyglutamate synthase